MNIVSLLTPHLNSFGWLCWLLNDLDVSTSSATPIYNDNQSAIHVTCNDAFPKRTKYIEIDCHLARHHLLKSSLPLLLFSSQDQLANIFMRPLPMAHFHALFDKLKLVTHPRV